MATTFYFRVPARSSRSARLPFPDTFFEVQAQNLADAWRKVKDATNATRIFALDFNAKEKYPAETFSFLK